MSASSPPRPSRRCSAWATPSGSATAGIIANANGFSGGFTKAAATTAAPPLFLYFIPIALLGCVAAFRLDGNRADGPGR